MRFKLLSKSFEVGKELSAKQELKRYEDQPNLQGWIQELLSAESLVD